MSHSPDRSESSPLPPDRLETLVDAALRGDEAVAANEAERSFLDAVRLVRTELLAESAEFSGGVPESVVMNAKALAALLPRRDQRGVRHWWDRTVAAIASCLHDDAATPAFAGLRRSGSVRQASFSTRLRDRELSIDLEIEMRLDPDRAAIRGQIAFGVGEVPRVGTVALVREGQALQTAVIDEDGFFGLEAPAGRCDLAVHLGEAGTVVLPDLEIP
ncbi:MAG: hypothetical protein ACO4CI_12260 [Phycisphaerales bacterium]